jgi:hypothetical protein
MYVARGRLLVDTAGNVSLNGRRGAASVEKSRRT